MAKWMRGELESEGQDITCGREVENFALDPGYIKSLQQECLFLFTGNQVSIRWGFAAHVISGRSNDPQDPSPEPL
jgi:hypothetical protein